MSTAIPPHLLPADPRFGSGPAKVRPEALQRVADSSLMGTSHRQPAVKNLVASVQHQLAELYDLPTGYEVVLGNGGATIFWDVAVCSLIEQRSAHGVYGEFSRKFATASARAPFVGAPALFEAEPGSVRLPEATEGADVYAWAQNETSTGACAPVHRPAGSDPEALVVIDATSASGGMPIDLAQTDVTYFAPQKNYSSDGGLWLAFCSPAALARAERLGAAHQRWVPESLNLAVAAANSRAHQTLNTPALATLLLLDAQLGWMLDNGGLDFVTRRTRASSGLVYDWADKHHLARPFVAPEFRSPVVATIDFDDSVDAAALAASLRANGILDTEPYRKLGRNQLRIGCFASVDPADIQALLGCIDYLLERQAA